MEENKNRNQLYIPANVKTGTEFFRGFGVNELKKALAVMAAVGVVLFLVYQRTQNVVQLIVGIMIAAGVSVAIFSKDDCNTSFVDTMSYMIRFSQQQKRYPYRFAKEDWYIDP